MFDIFLKEDVHKLMKQKSIVFLGDSNVRALYKDFLCLLHNSEFITDRILRTKMESTVFGDKLVHHGETTNARHYREEREAMIESSHVSFFFLTKIYDDYVKEVLKKITTKSNPDVIVINSCLWDITRWGCDGVEHFKVNLNSLMNEFKVLLPGCLIIWVTAPPIACELKGGFLVQELQFLKYSLRFHVVEANHYARKIVINNGFDVLDTHYHLHVQIHRRCKDGIHWSPKAVRYITNLLLTHISLSWDVTLPHKYESISVDENVLVREDTTDSAVSEEEETENADNMIQKCSEKSIASLESNEKRINTINRQDKTRKKESIHNHMKNNDMKARRNRIRKWKKRSMDNPQAASSSTEANFRDHSVFNQNFPSNRNYTYFPSNNFYHPEPGFMSNFRDHSHFQNYGVPYSSPPVIHRQPHPSNSHFQNYDVPYSFPPVIRRQPLLPYYNFANEVPPNFRF